MRCNLQGLRTQGFRVEIFGSVFTIVGFLRALSDLIRVLFVVYRVVGLRAWPLAGVSRREC